MASSDIERAFAKGVAERLGHYVYALRDPLRDGEVFYIGKGKGNRAYSHAQSAMARGERSPYEDLKLDRINAIHAAGQQVQIELIRHGLDEATAFEVEAGVIDALRMTKTLTNKASGKGFERGWHSLAEIVDRYGAMPAEIDPAHRVLLIRINKLFRHDMSDDELYEATRKWWANNPERRHPEWAFAVCYGIVRAVYRIERWERSPANWTPPRVAFHGVRDSAMESLYLRKDVSSKFKRGAQSPVLYVNC